MKLNENIGKPRKLWKTLNALELPSKVSIATINALKDHKVVKYDTNTIAKIFQMFFINMTETLPQRLPPAPNKQGTDLVNKLYKYLNITTKFLLKPTTEDVVLKLLKTLKFPMQQVLINWKVRFLKDGAVILAKPITKICNLSIQTRMKKVQNGPLHLQTYFVTALHFKDI